MNNMNNFSKLFNATLYRDSNPDHTKTLVGFQRRAADVHRAIVAVRADRDKQIKQAKRDYANERLDAEINGISEAYNSVLEAARKRLENDLDDVLTAKRMQYKRSQVAPTDADIRLLQTLRMRNDLTADDISAAAEQLSNTLPGLKALGSIAKDAGLPFPDLTRFDEQFELNMEAAQTHVERMLERLDIPDEQMGYLDREFFTAPGTGRTGSLFAPLDESVFTAAQLSTPEQSAVKAAQAELESMRTEKTGPTTTWNAAKVFLRGDESLAQIAAQFGIGTTAIRHANPDMDLDNLTGGSSIIVPATRFSYATAPGSVIPEQVVPARYDPAQRVTSFKPGDSVSVVEDC